MDLGAVGSERRYFCNGSSDQRASRGAFPTHTGRAFFGLNRREGDLTDTVHRHRASYFNASGAGRLAGAVRAAEKGVPFSNGGYVDVAVKN